MKNMRASCLELDQSPSARRERLEVHAIKTDGTGERFWGVTNMPNSGVPQKMFMSMAGKKESLDALQRGDNVSLDKRH